MGNEAGRRAVIVVAHGSRVESANEEMSKVVRDLRQLMSNERVMPAFLELASPDVQEAIDQAVIAGASEIIVVPYFLLMGNHIQEDLPSLVEETALRHPDTKIALAGHIGFHPLLADILIDRLSGLMDQSY